MKISAVVIDDEANAANSLRLLLGQFNEIIECKGVAHSALEGIKLIKSVSPQIVFLDINMPFHSGFEVLDHFNPEDFYVVFTTAHAEHAVKAIKHKAFDYLLKPIDTDELEIAILNVKNELQNNPKSTTTNTTAIAPPLSIPIKEGVIFLKQDEILRVEGDGSYSTFFTTDLKKYVVSKNLKEFEIILNPKEFFRAHKSHLINMKMVRKYIKTDGYYAEMSDGSIVEIARRKKEEFMQLMKESETI